MTAKEAPAAGESESSIPQDEKVGLISRSDGPHVAVLMCVYHPRIDYLREQLDSILNQTHGDVSIWVSDDGDDQATRDILAEYRARLPAERLTVVRGPARGFAANFLSLVNRPEIEADYYAFCDQDDIWEPGKIERALACLADVERDEPAVYGSRTRLIDEEGREIGFSPLFDKPPSFANALVQSLAGGNTMVFNDTARVLLVEAGMPEIASHDWWVYMLVSGGGGTVMYDPIPSILYRQHGQNLIGSSASIMALFSRLKGMLKNRFREWNTMNVAALQSIRHRLTNENQILLDTFSQARESSLATRLRLLRQCGVYRQTRVGTLAVWLAALMGKI